MLHWKCFYYRPSKNPQLQHVETLLLLLQEVLLYTDTYTPLYVRCSYVYICARSAHITYEYMCVCDVSFFFSSLCRFFFWVTQSNKTELVILYRPAQNFSPITSILNLCIFFSICFACVHIFHMPRLIYVTIHVRVYIYVASWGVCGERSWCLYHILIFYIPITDARSMYIDTCGQRLALGTLTYDVYFVVNSGIETLWFG